MPNKWKIAKVTPIHRKGNTNDYNNYRPISVLNTCSKTLERAVNKQLIDHLETNDFFQKRSSVIQKTELATILLSCGVLLLTCGVPQGSILGRLLFLMFFNDFEKCLKHSQSLNFADDTVVYVHGKTKDIVESQLNEDVKTMSTCLKKNQLILNLNRGKTETMIFGTSCKLSKCGKKLNLYYDDRVIHATETYKYLRTILDSTLSFSINFERMYKKQPPSFVDCTHYAYTSTALQKLRYSRRWFFPVSHTIAPQTWTWLRRKDKNYRPSID